MKIVMQEPIKTIYEYKGGIYVRPYGKGVCLTDITDWPDLADILSHGDYEADITIRRAGDCKKTPKH